LTAQLLTARHRHGFEYPPEFLRIVRLGLVQLEPWRILLGDELRSTARGLRWRYRGEGYIPFAARQDCDDLACWRARDPGPVVIVHDHSSRGWEARGRGFDDVSAWFRQAVEDCIEWGADDA
jgi:hypothetical protein